MNINERERRRLLKSLVGLGALSAAQAQALDLSRLSSRDATLGLREALIKAAEFATGQLGAANGFLGNPKVRIPLPDALGQAEQAARMFGLQGQFDALVSGMNRAAEASMGEARPLLVNAVRQMSVTDAKQILSGGDRSATDYFQRKTSGLLNQRILPIVHTQIGRIGLANQYNELASRASQYGLLNEENANLDRYVTGRAVQGLFTVVAEQEQAIRRDPVSTGSEILGRIFGRG